MTCGAVAWRILNIEGFFMSQEYQSMKVVCNLDKGHAQIEHAGYLQLKTPTGVVTGTVFW